jgi:hypothetical protein
MLPIDQFFSDLMQDGTVAARPETRRPGWNVFSVRKRSQRSGPVAPQAETLEVRSVPTAQILSALGNGVLTIIGSEGADRIQVTAGNGQVRVTDGTTAGEAAPSLFDLADVHDLRVLGLGGDDVITLRDSADLQEFSQLTAVSVDGGVGADRLFVTAANAVVARTAQDLVVTSQMARLVDLLREEGLAIGQALTNLTPHKDATRGEVQQFTFADIRVSGTFVEVYDSIEGELHRFTLNGNQLTRTEDAFATDYQLTQFMNYRAAYTRRPTLVVSIPGLSSTGLSTGADNGIERGYSWDSDGDVRGSSAWTERLSSNMARELNAAGSQVHVMLIDWASQSPASSATEKVADHIRSFLSGSQTTWDVSLTGHSRGGIFAAEVARFLDGHQRVGSLHLVMLDPTAAVSLNDQYPNRVASGVDRAVIFDDGLTLYPLSLTRESLPMAGADYLRVDVPGMGFGDSAGSHGKMPDWYAEILSRRGLLRTDNARELTFQRELAWLLGNNPAAGSAVVPSDPRAGMELVKAAPPANGLLHAIDIGLDPNRDGDAVAYVSVVGVGSGTVTIGKSGLNANLGVTNVGQGAFSFSDRGLVVGAAFPIWGPVNFGGQIMLGPETRLDVDFGPMRISLFGTRPGLYMGGQRVEFGSMLRGAAANASLSSGDIAAAMRSTFGFNSSDTARFMGTQLGFTPSRIADGLGRGLSAGVSEIALALRSGLNSTASDIAAALGSVSRDVEAIAGALRNQLGVSLNTVADVMYKSIGWTNYSDVARGLGSVTRDATAIAGALRNQLGVSLNTVADVMYRSISWTSYNDVARGLGSVTRDATAIAGALRNQLGVSLNTVADVMYKSIGWTNYSDVARGLGSVTRDATAIAGALRNQLGVSLNTVADVMYKSIGWTSYSDVARGLGSVTRDATAIAGALRNQLGVSLNTVADVMYKAIGWTSYSDVARGLGSVTRDATAIAGALRNQLGVSLNTVADVMYRSISWTNYSDVARGLGSVTRDATAIAGALRNQLGVSLNTVADVMYRSISWTSYNDVARGLGSVTRDVGAIAGALRNQLGVSLNTVADVMYRSISWTSYNDVARGLSAVTNDARTIANALRNGAGAAASSVTSALQSVGSGLQNLGSVISKVRIGNWSF